MNLDAVDKKTGKSISLLQTPTWVTNMCLFSWETENGKPKRRHWKDTRKIYLDWVGSRTNRVFYSEEEHRDEIEFVEEHKNRIMSFEEIEWYMI
jgi:hypothetical protein